MDSTRWAGYRPRPDDVIITTSYKGGTTWMQAICGALIFQSPDPPAVLDEISPWIDALFEPIDELYARIEAKAHRRYLKTHMPLTALPYFDEPRYIFVGRDGRDVFMSMWSHWNNFQPALREALNADPARVGPRWPPPPDDIQVAFDDWISRASFPWERDGYPFWSHHYHAQTWWDHRHRENILHVHFADLLDDLDGQMRRIAAFLDIPVDEAVWPSLVESVTFGEMKKNAATRAPGATKGIWKDPANFFHKGTNARWDGVLDRDQLERYDALIREQLEPDLYHWLTHQP